ncbi:MAG: response regulator, partial [Lachnospiraceae bacterium]
MYKVLLVDDEKYISRGLEMGVDWKSINVNTIYTAQNGAQALSLIHKKKPDVVVTDIRMPGMNGLELIQAAKVEYPDLPFIILSGYPDFAYAQKALQYGVFRYLLKPFDLIELTECIRLLLDTLPHKEPDFDTGELTAPSLNPTIQGILTFIEDNLTKEITIEMLSNSFGLTPNYLSSLFKKETGRGIVEHITRLRIEKACDMLIHTDHKVQYICTAVGISDYFYFSKLFKKYMQVTPTQFRTNNKDIRY